MNQPLAGMFCIRLPSFASAGLVGPNRLSSGRPRRQRVKGTTGCRHAGNGTANIAKVPGNVGALNISMFCCR
jgi:hypothetical protein